MAEPLEVASSVWARGLGLMGRRALPPNGGLLINRCTGIHMMFMRFSIDAVFMDRRGTVLKVYEGLRPWVGLVPLVWKADRVAELPAGTTSRLRIKPGDQLITESSPQSSI